MPSIEIPDIAMRSTTCKEWHNCCGAMVMFGDTATTSLKSRSHRMRVRVFWIGVEHGLYLHQRNGRCFGTTAMATGTTANAGGTR